MGIFKDLGKMYKDQLNKVGKAYKDQFVEIGKVLKGGASDDAGAPKTTTEKAAKAPASRSGGSRGGYVVEKPEDFEYDMSALADGVVIKRLKLEVKERNPTVVKVPAQIEGYPVVEIGLGAFKNVVNKAITTVILPDSIEILGAYAFGFMDSYFSSTLTTINFPKNLKAIGSYCFMQCNKLGAAIILPEGLTRIGQRAFDSTNITELVIPESVVQIGPNAFDACRELVSVKMPSHPVDYPAVPTERDQYGDILPFKDEWGCDLNGTPGFNDAFVDCGKLGLGAKKTIRDSGYKDHFSL